MRNAWPPSRRPAAARRGVAIPAASAALAAVLALADGAMTLERLIDGVPPEVVAGLARGWLISSLAP